MSTKIPFLAVLLWLVHTAGVSACQRTSCKTDKEASSCNDGLVALMKNMSSMLENMNNRLKTMETGQPSTWSQRNSSSNQPVATGNPQSSMVCRSLQSVQQSMEGRQRSIQNQQQSMERRQQSMERRQQSMERRQQSMDSRLQLMDSRLQLMDSRLQSMQSRLQSMSVERPAIEDTGDTRCLWTGGSSRTCYKLVHQKLTWSNSRQYCQSLAGGADLVAIESREENQFLVDMIDDLKQRSCVNFHTSGRKDSTGTWIWHSTGRPFQYNAWEHGEPSNDKGHEEALAFWHTDQYYRFWNDIPSSTSLCFICELD